jgi:hypothetical protein
MPSEQSPSSNARPTRTWSAAKGQHPPMIGGVRGLLGLPMRESGLLPTAPLTAPPRGHHYGQPPLSESEENEESFREIARDEELIEAGGSAGADPQSDFPGSLPHDGASFPRAIPENPADGRRAPAAISVEHREHTSFVIPGVSTHRTEFMALSHTSDTTKVTQPEESQEPGPDKMAPMHAHVSLPHPRETAMFDGEFLSRLEHLAIEGAKARNDSETQRRSVMGLSPSPVEQMGISNGQQGDTDVARRLAQLQRVVSDLAATVSSQAARSRDESQIQSRDQKKPPLQRTVIIKHSDGSSATPRAFWERSRLGRFFLKTGR